MTSTQPAAIVYELYSNWRQNPTGGLAEGVRLALKYRLYVPSTAYCLREELVELKESTWTTTTSNHDLVLAKDVATDKYVCCLYLRGYHLQAFTRKAYRRKGIAKEAIKRFGELPEDVYALGGVKGANKFWDKAGIKNC